MAANIEIIEDDGLRILHTSGMLVAPIPSDAGHASELFDPVTDPVVHRAIEAMHRHKEHPLDMVALAFDPAARTLSAEAVRNLAEHDVMVVRTDGETALARAQAFIEEFSQLAREGVEHLRRFAQVQRRRASGKEAD